MAKEDVPLFTLKLRRVAAGKSRKQLAEDAGIKPQSVRNLLSQGGIPRADVAAALAKSCGVDVRYLVDDSIPLDADPARSVVDRLQDASAIDLLRQYVKEYLKVALPIRHSLDRMTGGEWDRVAIWLLSNVVGREIPEPIGDAAKFIECVSMMCDGLPLLDFNEALDEELRRRGLDVKADKLKPECLLGDWDQERQQHPGIDAIIEYMTIEDARNIISPGGASEERFGLRGGSRKSDWMNTQAPYLLARLIAHADYSLEPKYQPLIEALKKHGYLDENGEPTEPEGFAPPSDASPESSIYDYIFDEDIPNFIEDENEKDD